MILLDMQSDTAKTALSRLLTGKDGGEGSIDFSKMLQELSLSLKEGDGNTKLPMVLLKGEGTEPVLGMPKTQKGKEAADLLQLLKGGETTEALPETLSHTELLDLQLLHPAIDRKASTESLRGLINDAKTYLKAQIETVQGPKESPNTLRGLVQLAERLGIDVAKITLEEVQPRRQAAATKPTVLQDAKTAAAIPDVQQHTTEELVRTKRTDLPAAERRALASSQKAETEAPLHRLLREEKVPAKQSRESQPSSIQDDASVAEDILSKQLPAKGKSLPEMAEQPRTTKPEVAAPQAKTDAAAPLQEIETKPKSTTAATHHSSQNGNSNLFEQHGAANALSADDAPENTSGKQPLFGTALSQLLKGESDTTQATAEEEQRSHEPVTELKSPATAAVSLPKDELELKIGEAKQMVRHFVSEIKEAVQNYKPPFTRIKIQLNPVKLGEVDVTMVQRGNNVHINISSNTAAITTLAQNASELRTQLGQNGMGNATMNFSSNANAEQQQQQQRQHMAELYEAYEHSENFELLEQLELIVPRYV